jgi:2-C-methyl-D-erythritol 4-phosphate cytidylyltransferase
MKKKITAIVLAAGSGRRMGGDIPKQYMELSGKPVIYYSLKVFQDSVVDDIVLVVSDEYIEYCRKEIVERYGFSKVTDIISGGRERYDSVRNGLEACESADYVLIHDGARPLITGGMVKRSIATLEEETGCSVAVKAKDTIKISDENDYGVDTPDRRYVWQVQTPQSFRRRELVAAYEKLAASGDTAITDDTMIMERYGGVKIKLIDGSYANIKITTPEDLALAEVLLEHRL